MRNQFDENIFRENDFTKNENKIIHKSIPLQLLRLSLLLLGVH